MSIKKIVAAFVASILAVTCLSCAVFAASESTSYVTIRKYFEDNSTPSEELLAATKFEIYTDLACTKVATAVTKYRAPSSCYYEFNGLAKSTTYYIKEVATKAEYKVSTEIVIVIVDAEGKVSQSETAIINYLAPAVTTTTAAETTTNDAKTTTESPVITIPLESVATTTKAPVVTTVTTKATTTTTKPPQTVVPATTTRPPVTVGQEQSEATTTPFVTEAPIADITEETNLTTTVPPTTTTSDETTAPAETTSADGENGGNNGFVTAIIIAATVFVVLVAAMIISRYVHINNNYKY